MTILEQVLANIDRDRLVKTAMDLVDIWSPTGHEGPAAEYMDARFRELGMKARLQELESGRANSIGTLEGSGGGVHLMFDGHLDTSYTGKEAYLPQTPSYQPKAYIEDGWIYGLGVYNMKGAVACYLAAVEAVIKAGVKLKGDVTVAAVAGEIEKGPVDRYQGPEYRGGGSGTWYLVNHGGVADMCIIGEPTNLRLLRGHMGYHWTRINILGTPAHTTYSDKAVNAILKATQVIEAIQEWGKVYKRTHTYGNVSANVTLSAIEGGWPYRCSRTPIYCTLYVDTRVLPGQEPTEVKRAIAGILADLKAQDPELKVEMDMFMTVPGAEVHEDAPVMQAVARAHQTIFGKPVEIITEGYVSDGSVLNRYGIPTVNYGPTGASRSAEDGIPTWDPSVGEHAKIENLYQCARVYASLIMDICTKDRAAVVGSL